jgi:hypothetical protein
MLSRIERAAKAIAETKYIVERELRENERYRQTPISDLIEDASSIIAENITLFLAELHNESYARGERSMQSRYDYPQEMGQ